MKLKIYTHNSADLILGQRPFEDIYKNLLWICENTPLPIYKKKSNTQRKLDVVQQIMDSYLNLQLKIQGWETSFPFSINSDFIKLDYIKDIDFKNRQYQIHLEVEFGNVASSYRNYFKLQLVNNTVDNYIGIIVLPTESLAKRIDSGVGSYEKTVNEISFAKDLFNFPLVIIGLDDEDTEELKLEQSLLSLKELQNKKLVKHELFVLEYVNKLNEKARNN